MSRHLWCGSIRGDVLYDDLWAAFRRFGDVEDIDLHRAPAGSDRWAVVTFRDPASVPAALERFDLNQPHLTNKFLKLREWVDKTAGSLRRAPLNPPSRWERPSTAWADAEDSDAALDSGEERQHWRHGQQAGAAAETPSWRQRSWQGASGHGQWDHERHHVELEEGEEEEEWGDGEEEDEEEGDDPLVELWVGNLCSTAQRTAIRRAFQCFGDVAGVTMQAAPSAPALRFAFVSLPASAAETAVEELDGLQVYELSGELPLKVRQSARSLKTLQRWQQRRVSAQQQSLAHGPAVSKPVQLQQCQQGTAQLEVVCGDGKVALLQGHVGTTKKFFLCDGPPSRILWVGSVAGSATASDMHRVFSSYGKVVKARLNQAPGFQNPFQYGLVTMGSAAEAEVAFAALQGSEAADLYGGRLLKLRYAWPQNAVRPADHAVYAAPPASSTKSAGSAKAAGGAAEPARTARAPPTAAALHPTCCGVCGATGELGVQLQRCSLCKAVFYCSRDCQLAGWEAGHSTECGQLQQLAAALRQPETAPEVGALVLAAVQQPSGRQRQLVDGALQHAASALQQTPSPP